MLKIFASRILAAACLLLAARAPAQPRPSDPPEAAKDKDKDKDRDKEGRLIKWDMTETPPVVTRHKIKLADGSLSYTATAGRMPIRDPPGNTEALMFYV